MLRESERKRGKHINEKQLFSVIFVLFRTKDQYQVVASHIYTCAGLNILTLATKKENINTTVCG